MTFYCILEVVALFFALGRLHFSFSIVQFNLLCLFFLKLSVVYVYPRAQASRVMYLIGLVSVYIYVINIFL